MALVPFASVDRSALGWLRTSETPEEFTLSSENQPILVLRWPERRGGALDVTAADDHWILERRGFLRPELWARSPADRAVRARVSHRQVVLPDGIAYGFSRLPGFELPSWQIRDATGTELVHLEPVREGRRLSGGAVLVSPAGTELPLLPTILALAWAFVALSWFEDEAFVPFEDLRESPNNPDVD